MDYLNVCSSAISVLQDRALRAITQVTARYLLPIESRRISSLSREEFFNEKVDQVFSFDVGCIADRGWVYVFCTTEEGLLWFGQIENERLHISDFKVVSAKGAAALAIHPEKNYVVSVGSNIDLFEFLHD